MWLSEYTTLTRPIFEVFLTTRLAIQTLLSMHGLQECGTAHYKHTASSLGGLREDYQSAVAALGLPRSVVLSSDLPEVEVTSVPKSFPCTLAFHFHVVRFGRPTTLAMTHLGQRAFFLVDDPTGDSVELELLPSVRVCFLNGALCAQSRFFLVLGLRNQVDVEFDTLPFLLLPFHVPCPESVEWLMETANTMDCMIEEFDKQTRRTNTRHQPHAQTFRYQQADALLQHAPRSLPLM